MVLLIPLVCTTLTVRGLAWLLRRRGFQILDPWNCWSAAMSAGMAVVFACTAVAHFIEPARSGLAAIVPRIGIDPLIVVTLSGVVELILAVGLLVPRTRVWAGAVSVLFLIALFPANVIAANGVDNPAAPSTPLLPRAILQLVFIAAAGYPLIAKLAAPRRRARIGSPEGERRPPVSVGDGGAGESMGS